MNRLTAFLIALAIVIGFSACAPKKDDDRPPTAKVERRDVKDVVQWSGKVTSAKKVPVFSEATGQIVKLHVDQGQKVAQGDPLLEIDKTQLVNSIEKQRIALEKARIQLDNAQTDFTRKKALHDERFIARSEFEKAEQALNLSRLDHSMAAKDLEALEQQLGKLIVTSPISGIVTKKNVEEGEVVGSMTTGSQGKLLLEIMDPDQKRITMNLSEVERSLVSPGQKVEFWLEFVEAKRLMGRVIKIDESPQTVEGSTRFRAEIEPESAEGLTIGNTVTVMALIAESKGTLAVPVEAVFRSGESPYVHLKKKSSHEKRPVETGVSGTDYVEIKSGLAEGDEVYREEPAP